MPHPNVPSRLRASLRIWPRVAVFALIGIAAAGCSDSARFDSNPFASNDRAPPPPSGQQDITGSVSSRPASANRVSSQPLPAPSRPATVASSNSGANNGQGFAAYRPVPHSTAPKAAAPSRISANAHVVAAGETLYGIARKHNITPTALARANNLQLTAKLNIGDRLNIPGGHAAVAHQAPPRVTQPRTVKAEKVASIPVEKARIATPVTHTTESVTKTAEAAGGIPSFRWPVKGRVIAGFGKRPNGTENDGINLAVPEGTPVKAAEDGVVAYAGNELKGYGNLVLVRHANGYVSAYANASALLVKRGDTIKRGQVIARAGQTGNVTSPQLHFEIRKGSVPVDPVKYLSGA
jgi:murein DD-endopeptidase MepM/ murein hydrolase activator NlpD